MEEMKEGVLDSECRQEEANTEPGTTAGDIEPETPTDGSEDVNPAQKTEDITPGEETEKGEKETTEATVEESETEEMKTDESVKILELLQGLHAKFDKKIAVDAHKNELFTKMHDELVALRNDKEGERLKAICIEIILVIDSMHKNEELYQNAEPSADMYQKLNRAYTAIRQQLEDILYQQSIEPYETSGDEVNVRRQKIIATVPTEDESLDNRIAARVAAGYEKDDKVIRPERIKVYKYSETK